MEAIDKFFVIGIVCWVVVSYLWVTDRIRRSRRKKCIRPDTEKWLANQIIKGVHGNDPEWLSHIQGRLKEIK